MISKVLVLAAAFGLASSPASATIVNISGTQNGEQSSGFSGQTGPLINPVRLTFQPGTYRITDAFSPSTGYAAGALYDAWNFEAGNPQAWAWHWKALLDDGADGAMINNANYGTHLLLDIDAPNPQDTFTTESAAAAFGAATAPSFLTFATATTVDFVVDDYYLPDNAGGVSLDVEAVSASTPAVPEPATWAMMVGGLGLMGGAMRRRRSAAAVPSGDGRRCA